MKRRKDVSGSSSEEKPKKKVKVKVDIEVDIKKKKKKEVEEDGEEIKEFFFDHMGWTEIQIADELHRRLLLPKNNKDKIFGKDLSEPYDQRFILLNSSTARQYVLDQQRKNSKREGWCLISNLQHSKGGQKTKRGKEKKGYPQPSYFNAKPFTLQKLAYYHVTGELTDEDNHCSHRCIHDTLCWELTHIVNETVELNNGRKGCLVWVSCSHDENCDKLIIVCSHDPICVKFYDHAKNMEDILINHAHPHYELYLSQSQSETDIIKKINKD